MLELSSYIYELQYGVCHGITIDYWKDSIINLTQWHNRLKHGIEIDYYLDGSVCRLAQWRHGILHGLGVHYHPNGSIQEMSH